MAIAQTVTLDLDSLATYCQETGRSLEALDFTRPLKVSRLLVVADIREQFAGSHGPDGTPWAPLKHRKGQPLRDKGLLMNAWTVNPVETLTADTMVLTNILEYAALQHFGGTVHKAEQTRPYPETPWVFTTADGETVFTRRIKAHTVTVPARPVGVSAAAADKIGLAFAEHVEGIL